MSDIMEWDSSLFKDGSSNDLPDGILSGDDPDDPFFTTLMAVRSSVAGIRMAVMAMAVRTMAVETITGVWVAVMAVAVTARTFITGVRAAIMLMAVWTFICGGRSFIPRTNIFITVITTVGYWDIDG